MELNGMWTISLTSYIPRGSGFMMIKLSCSTFLRMELVL